MASAPETAARARRLDDLLDRAAAGASLLCLVHCLVLPLALAMLPALGSVLQLPESLHIGLLLFALPTSLWALLSGRAHHGARAPLALGISGLVLLGGGLMLESVGLEVPATVAGSLLLCAAHAWNWCLRHAAQKPVAPAGELR